MPYFDTSEVEAEGEGDRSSLKPKNGKEKANCSPNPAMNYFPSAVPISQLNPTFVFSSA